MASQLYMAIWKSVSGKFLIFVVQFILMLVYARMFTPEQFGTIASISVFVAFFQMIADMGLGPAIVNQEKFSKEQRNGVFSFTILLGILFSLSFYIFSFALSAFYDGYDYSYIAILVSISIFFNTVNILPITAMNKDVIFIRVALVSLLTELITLYFIYVLVEKNFGIIALASKPALNAMLRFFLLWLLAKNTTLGRPYIGKNISHVKVLYEFSIYQFGFNVINYFSRNLDNILVGRYFGMSELGIYDKAYNLMRYPLTLTTFAMTPAIQPVLRKHQGDKELIYKHHELLAIRLFIISVLIAVFMFFNANDIVRLLLGETWMNVSPLIKILAISIPIQAVGSCSGSFYQVMNNTKSLFLSGNLTALVNCTGIAIGIYLGDIVSLSISVVISFSISFFINHHILGCYVYKRSMKFFYLSLMKALVWLSPVLVVYWIIRHYAFTLYSLDGMLFNVLYALLSLLLCFKLVRKNLQI